MPICVVLDLLQFGVRFDVAAKCAAGFVGDAAVKPCADNLQEYQLLLGRFFLLALHLVVLRVH